ncbi:MAG: hypothetical protein JNN04_06300 [Cyclobacteriaceae bacterium]|nr:hypothetical protein [Cyclobacteriaceae bacterium]
MRRLAAIGMLVLHLSLFTEMNELMRLPLLVEHFMEHQAMVPEMSFFQFLAMHYKTDVAHDSTDMELPFKSCDHSVASPTFTFPQQEFELITAFTSATLQFPSHYNSFIPSTGLNEIFQPPRIA